MVFEQQAITYGALDRAAQRIADHLRRAGVMPGRPVGLYVPRSIRMIVGMLGIMKAGGAYVLGLVVPGTKGLRSFRVAQPSVLVMPMVTLTIVQASSV